MTLWVDGVAVGSAPVGTASFDDHAIRFGCDDDGGFDAFFYDGFLADIRIYGRALDAMEIAELASEIPADP